MRKFYGGPRLGYRTSGRSTAAPAAPPVAPTAAPTFVAAVGNINFATTNAVPALTCQAGDILVAFAYGNAQVGTLTPPDGTWTQIGDHPVGNEPRGRILTKVATGSLPAQTWTWPGSHNHTVVISAWRGAQAPTAASGSALVTNTTTVNAPSVTTVAVNSLLVTFGFHTSAGGTSAGFSGMTERRNAAAAVAGSVLASEVRATAGATGVRTYTIAPGPASLLACSLVIPPA